MTELRVMVGGGDVVSFLEGMLDKARRGEFEAVAIATLESDHSVGAGLAFKPDADHLFARTLGAVTNLQAAILEGRLTFNG